MPTFDKLWGITDCSLVYTSEEKAKAMSEWIKTRLKFWTEEQKAQKYRVYEVYPDCFIGKIQRGYDTWIVKMARDGTVIKCERTEILPTRFGFSTTKIVDDFPKGKYLWFTCLALDEKEAAALCDKARIKTLLDDAWFTKDIGGLT
jgi:hypothetical protein